MTLDEQTAAVKEGVLTALSPEKFKAWLEGQSPAGCKMRRADGESCPIARYLEAQNYNANVDTTVIVLADSVRDMGFPADVRVVPPRWVTEFVSLIDDGDTTGGFVGVLEALAVLAEVTPVVPSDADDGDAHPELVL